MKVLVTGGRDFMNFEVIEKVLDGIDYHEGIDSIVHGHAKGADTLADDWAEMRNKKVFRYPITRKDWKKYGLKAGAIRNSLMLKLHPDINLVVAFPGDRGTFDMTEKARKRGINVLQIMHVPKKSEFDIVESSSGVYSLDNAKPEPREVDADEDED